MGRQAKTTPNEVVSEWLIEHRWQNMTAELQYRLPAFVEEAVYAALYIVAGTRAGRVNVRPKLVFKALMLPYISTESVKPLEVGYDLSDRQAQRLAQTARFALAGIERRVINETKDKPKDHIALLNAQIEREFREGCKNDVDDSFWLYSAPISNPPANILVAYEEGDFEGYGAKLREYRRNE